MQPARATNSNNPTNGRYMKDSDHHEELKAIVAAHGLTQREVAELLSRATGDNHPPRTVRRWMNARGLKNSRSCPGWVIYILKRELA